MVKLAEGKLKRGAKPETVTVTIPPIARRMGELATATIQVTVATTRPWGINMKQHWKIKKVEAQNIVNHGQGWLVI